MKIAIVGTGIAGNVVAHHLHKTHDITVFEANHYVGGHSNTVEIPSPDGVLRLDTGFIVYNDRTYPNFIRLLASLDVESQETSMSFSVQNARTGLEYNGSSLNTLFAQRRNLLRPSFHRMIRDILRFNREAPALLESVNTDLTLADYVRAGGFSAAFAREYLIPMGAAIWSAPPNTMERMPAGFFVRFFRNHGLLSINDRPVWRVIRGGSRSYVDELTSAHRDRIRLDCPVEWIRRQANGVVIKARGATPEHFEHVFLACHSDQALGLLRDSLPLEREVLGAIPYQYNEAVLHTDDSLMPRSKRAWAAWNYHVPRDADRPVAVTYHLNRLQGLDTATQYFVTLNYADRIRPDSVIRRFTYEHPVFTAASVAAQRRHEHINGLNRTWYCGAYWRYGFHEDGVVSALAALRRFESSEEDAQRHFQRAS